MITLNFILGKEAVEIFENDFDSFLQYAEEENPDCLNTKQFYTENEKQQFIAGLEAGGYENYSLLDEEEAKKILAVIY